MRINLICLGAIAGGFGGIFPAQAQPVLPTEVYGPSTVVMVKLNLARLTPENVQQAVIALVDTGALAQRGINANPQNAVERLPLIQLTPLQMLSQWGVDTLIIAVNAAPEGSGNSYWTQALVPVAPGTDPEVLASPLELLVTSLPGGNLGAGASHGVLTQYVDDTRTDTWLCAGPVGTTVPSEWSPARQERFDAALAASAGHDFAWAFVANFSVTDPAMARIEASIRRPSNDPLAPFIQQAAIDMIHSLINAPWVGGYVDLGSQPSLLVGLMGAGADHVLGAQAAHAMLMDKLRERARNQDSQPRQGPPPTVTSIDAANAVARTFALEQNGTLMYVQATSQELRDLTTITLCLVDDLMGGLVNQMFSPRPPGAPPQ